MIKLIIYLIFSISVLGNSIISPAMGTLANHFQGANQTLIKLILTIPSITVIIACIFSMSLSKKFGKKNILMLSLFIYGFAGCASAFSENIYHMLFWRAILGIGIGLLTPLSQTLPSDFFVGTERQVTYARAGSSISVGNMIFITLAGYLATYSWRYTFAIYLVGFFVMLTVFFFLPKKANITAEVEEEKNKNQENKLNPKVYLAFISVFLFMASVYVLFTNLAILMNTRNIGSPTIAGYILATNSLCSFCVSYNLVKIRKALGRFIYLLVPLFLFSAHMLIYFAYNVPQLFLAQICNAIAMGITMPLTSIAVSELSNTRNLTKGMALMTISIFLGQLASPFISSYLPRFHGFNNEAGVFFSIAIFMAFVFCAMLCYLLFSFFCLRRPKELSPFGNPSMQGKDKNI